ncbi:unnamed protein product, partial [Didymodactylos carnosus]
MKSSFVRNISTKQAMDQIKVVLDNKKVVSKDNEEIVYLNVGNEKMATKRSTLTCVPNTLLTKMFTENYQTLLKDRDGYIFLDYDPTAFRHLLNQLRQLNSSETPLIINPPTGDLTDTYLFMVKQLGFTQTQNKLHTIQFDSNSINGKIEENGLVASHDSDWTCAEIRSFQTFSFGVHHIKIKIENLYGDLFLGIVSKNMIERHIFSFSNRSLYGWTIRELYLNGVYHAHYGNSRNGNMKQNDIVEITIDCENKKFKMNNACQHHEISIDIEQCPFPWQFITMMT